MTVGISTVGVNPGTILIVDDEAEFVEVIQEVLRGEGYDVVGITDPSRAIELVHKNRYDLIITDLKMPGVDGLELTRAAKEQNESTEVIVITGYASLESAMMALKHGVYDFMLKPFDVADIHKTVKNAMEKIRLRRENEYLTHKLEKTLSDLSTVYEISRFINSSYDLNEVLSFTSETLASTIGLDVFAIFLWDRKNGYFRICKSSGLSEETEKNLRVGRNDGALGKAFEKDDLNFVDSLKDDATFKKEAAKSDLKKYKTAAVFPLKADDAAFGAVMIFKVNDESPDDMEKLRLASITMTQITPIIRFYVFKNDQSIMWSDPLFQVKEEMKKILEKAKLYKGGLIFLMLKLYLKHGGSKNYRILDIHQELLQRLNESVSAIDSIIVFGIDSFVVVLQGRSQVESEVFAGKLKKEVESHVFKPAHVDFVLDYGYSIFPADGTTAEELIGRAQYNLWSAVKSK